MMKRYAFTMLELIFVIIVIAILAVLALPNFNRDLLSEAAQQVASHIRYTQHLAMNDDVFDPLQPHWYYARPQISFRNCNGGGSTYYYIGSDSDYSTGHIAENEAAIDPLTKKVLYWQNGQCNSDTYPNRESALLLTETYGVTANSSCGSTISFDHMGRPYDAFSTSVPVSGQLTADCTITLTAQDGKTAVLTVRPTTGYVSISYP